MEEVSVVSEAIMEDLLVSEPGVVSEIWVVAEDEVKTLLGTNAVGESKVTSVAMVVSEPIGSSESVVEARMDTGAVIEDLMVSESMGETVVISEPSMVS